MLYDMCSIPMSSLSSAALAQCLKYNPAYATQKAHHRCCSVTVAPAIL